MFFRHLWAQDWFQGVKMDPNEPAWSQHDSKNKPKAASIESKTANMASEAPKARHKVIK